MRPFSRFAAPIVSTLLLLSAFSPVSVALVLILQPLPSWWLNAIASLVLALPVLLIPLTFRVARRLGPSRLRSKKVRRRDADNLSLMSSFIVPISVALVAPEGARSIASFVLLALLAAFYVLSGLQYLNPLIVLFGFHVYSIEQKNGAEVFLISRANHISQEALIDAFAYSDLIHIHRED